MSDETAPPAPSGRTLDVGLLWHSDASGNLGVGALTVGNMTLADRAAARAGVALNYHLFTPREPDHPYVTEGIVARHDIDARFMGDPRGYWRAVSQLDVLLDIGAGDSFADIYPSKRFAYIMATKAVGVARGVPLVLSPQTIGPFTRQPHRLAGAWALRRAEQVWARDPLSAAEARRMAPGVRVEEAVDVAFALPHAPRAKAGGGRLQFGLGVSGLLYSGGYTGRNEFGMEADYPGVLHGIVESLLERGDTDVWLVSHVRARHHPAEDDATAARALQRRYPRVEVAPDFLSPSEAKSWISGLDFLTAARMHATIAAYSTGVPVVPMSYSRKFEGLFSALGYPWLVPVKGVSTAAAVDRVLDALDRRQELAADIARGRPVVEAGLERYVAGLAGLFERLAAGR